MSKRHLGNLINAVKKVLRESKKIDNYDAAKVDDAIAHMQRMYNLFKKSRTTSAAAILRERRERDRYET